MQESCALGTVEHCLDRLQAYRDAGADEIAVYGSTPMENEHLIAGWRERSQRSQFAATSGGSHSSTYLRRGAV